MRSGHVVQDDADVGWFQRACAAGVCEEVGGWSGEGEAEDVVMGGIGEDERGPEVELAGTGLEVRLEGVEGWEVGVGGEGEG